MYAVCFRGDFTIKTVHAQKFAWKNVAYVEAFYFSCWLPSCLYVNCFTSAVGTPTMFVVVGLDSFSAVPSLPVQSDEYLEKLPNSQPAALVVHTRSDLIPLWRFTLNIYAEFYTCSHTLYTHLSVSSKTGSVETASEKLILIRRCCNVYMHSWHCATRL